ncbi:hypothetical protein SAMN05421640_0608 [Ekhidna lutea]|uniref:Outer membrane protein beta-barrel domain-containing protein n=1 Tax=Ekhidna lutea TaxID=447679 RepID=A0A239FC44_EKHLU|nr:hypothetical protein [Ekhidna lutea]SNS54620.1 hypothetical protein SAMN05421640_0608 [Ekhidna lutea]
MSFFAVAQTYVDTHDPDDEEIKSLLSKQNDLNAFGAADLKVGDLKRERALLVGAYGGFIINRRYLFGVAGYGLVTNVEFEGLVQGQTDEKKLNLHGGYGGVLIGWTIAHKELVHISIPIVLGAGSFDVVDKDFFVNNPADSEFTIESSVFFVAEPGLEAEFNITKYFRLGAGLTYRYISGVELENVKDDEITGTTAIISFRFGRF